MVSVKELKSIDLTSYTIILTGISLIFSIIIAICTTIGIGILSPQSIGVLLYIIPTIIVGTFMYSIYNSFTQGLFYNLLAKKFNTIKFTFNDDKEIVKISSAETATMIATIILIQSILLYLVSSFILPLVLNATIQTLMLGGQEVAAYTLYQILVILNEPSSLIIFILGSFIISFVFVLIGTYIYNILGSNKRGIIVNLSKNDIYTEIESIDLLRFAIAFSIISGIINIIIAIIMLISGGNGTQALVNMIVGFVGGFIEAALIALFYNYLSPKLGKLKLELIDQ